MGQILGWLGGGIGGGYGGGIGARGATCGFNACFPPDTLVASAAGRGPSQRSKREIACGGTISRLAPASLRGGSPTDSGYSGPLVTLDIGVDVVTATAYHPFWVVQGEDLYRRPALRHVGIEEDRNGTMRGRWVNSHDACEGDLVVIRTGCTAKVRSVGTRDVSLTVCYFTVGDLHTFAVGDAQILVHNVSGSTPAPDPANLPWGGRKPHLDFGS